MIFKCPECSREFTGPETENIVFKNGKFSQLPKATEYLICSECYETIMELQKKKKNKGEKQ